MELLLSQESWLKILSFCDNKIFTLRAQSFSRPDVLARFAKLSQTEIHPVAPPPHN